MTQYELTRMVSYWILYHRDPRNQDKWQAWSATKEHLDYLVDYEPRDAWTLIAAIHTKDQTAAVNQSLCPGPLERLLTEHGPLLIDSIAAFARQTPSFASLLRPLWRGTIDDEVWARLQCIRERRVWRPQVEHHAW